MAEYQAYGAWTRYKGNDAMMFYFKENYANGLIAVVEAKSNAEAMQLLADKVGQKVWERILKQGYVISPARHGGVDVIVTHWGRYAKR